MASQPIEDDAPAGMWRFSAIRSFTCLSPAALCSALVPSAFRGGVQVELPAPVYAGKR